MFGITRNSYTAGRLRRAVAARRSVSAGSAAVLAGAVVGLSMALFSPAPALAQLTETESIVNRLIRIEREVQTLNLQVYRGDPAPPSAPGTLAAMPEGYAAQFEIRLTQIERQLRDFTGQLEQSQFRTRQLTDRLDRALTDIEYRLTLLEGGEPPEPGSAARAPVDNGALLAPAPAAEAPTQLATAPIAANVSPLGLSAEPATTIVPGTEAAPAAMAAAAPAAVELPAGSADTQYDFAYGLLAQGDYDRAEQALSKFAEAHPENPLTSNAQYWLGETFYVRGQYDDAAIAFAQGYQAVEGQGREQLNRQNLPETLGRKEAGEAGEGQCRQQEERCPRTSGEVGETGHRRQGQNLDPEGQGQQHADFGSGQAPVGQPDRPEGQVGAECEKHRGVVAGVAGGEQALGHDRRSIGGRRANRSRKRSTGPGS